MLNTNSALNRGDVGSGAYLYMMSLSEQLTHIEFARTIWVQGAAGDLVDPLAITLIRVASG